MAPDPSHEVGKRIVSVPRRHGKTSQMWIDLLEAIQAIEDAKVVLVVSDKVKLPRIAVEAERMGLVQIERHPYLPEGVILQTTVGKIRELETPTW